MQGQSAELAEIELNLHLCRTLIPSQEWAEGHPEDDLLEVELLLMSIKTNLAAVAKLRNVVRVSTSSNAKHN